MVEEIQQVVGPDKIDQTMAGWEKIQHLVADPNNLIVLFIFAFGLVLKQSKHIPDWTITFIVPCFGALVAYGLFDVVEHRLPALVASMLGFVYGVVSVFSHQCLENLLKSPYGAVLMKIPLMPIIAGMMGIEIPQPDQPKPNNEKPTP